MVRLGRRRLLAAAAASVALAGARRVFAEEPACPAGKAYWETTAFDGDHDATAPVDGLTLGVASRGRWTGPVVEAAFLEAVPSWQADTPPGTWIEIELRASLDRGWTDWAKLGRWHTGEAPVVRGSIGGQPIVDVDTLVLEQPASAVQARVTLEATESDRTPRLRALGIALSGWPDRAGVVPPLGLASDLSVPPRSQMVFPDGGRVWCSPTSLSMVMAYWAGQVGEPSWDMPVPTVVRGVLDQARGIAGNWPFNTAFAAALGLRARVLRLASLAEVEPWTDAGVPVIASIRFRVGELAGAPISSALGGHLLVIRGFTRGGDVLANDPAASSDRGVPRRYGRSQFERVWLNGSNGLVYLVHPPDWPVPALPRRCA
ncbi:MAG TPA: C39 family peptidase [Chloroflexota bacterium]|jgi:hypothetical protein